jgi:hypothetical protein
MDQAQDIIADNFLQVDQRGALCIFIEKAETDLIDTLLGLQAEGFLMCKYPTMTNDSCLACKLKDGNNELIPYLAGELFVDETHYKWYYDRLTPQEQGKDWKFDFSGVQHSHQYGVAETTTVPVPKWVQAEGGLGETYTYNKSVPDELTEKQIDTGVARLNISGCIQLQFRMKDQEPETEDAYNDPTIRFDLDDNGTPKEFIFKGGITQFGASHVSDPNYTGTLNNPFWTRARIGGIHPQGFFWEDYYDDHKTPADDWIPMAFYDTYGLDDAWEVVMYTIKCWRYMDRRIGTWRYVCIDVLPDLDFNSHGFHSETAKLKFNKLQLNSVAPAEDLDLHPLEYLKEQEA